MSDQIVDDCINMTVNMEENIAIKEEVVDSDDTNANIPVSDFIPDKRANVVEFYEVDPQYIKLESNQSNRIECALSRSSNIGNSGSSVGRIKSHVGTKCDRAFSHKGLLNQHISAVQLELKKFACDECDDAFTKQGDLKRHLDTVHEMLKKSSSGKGDRALTEKTTVVDFDNSGSNIPLSKFIPEERDNVAELYEVETRYIKLESNESNRITGESPGSNKIGDSGQYVGRIKSHVCPDCDRTFARKGHLNEHISTVHLKLKKFSCVSCGGAFKRQGDLSRHVDSVHRKLRKFSCGECNRTFIEKAHLKVHIESIHSKLKRFVCNECDRAFSSHDTLKRHSDSIHRKLKTFSCGECDRVFSWGPSLKVHLDVVHRKLKTNLCAECNSSFGYKSQLIRHLKKIHPAV